MSFILEILMDKAGKDRQPRTTAGSIGSVGEYKAA
jgi:hypothetical protein